MPIIPNAFQSLEEDLGGQILRIITVADFKIDVVIDLAYIFSYSKPKDSGFVRASLMRATSSLRSFCFAQSCFDYKPVKSY